MPTQKLPNYLRTYRKRAGLSQDEVAFLLGCSNATKVSRYERFDRKPALETALACKAVFRVPVEQLFGGVYQKVERQTTRRAKLLIKKLERAKSNRMTVRKLEILRTVFSPTEAEPSENP